MALENRHQKILEAIFEKPERANIPWKGIEALFLALVGEITEGRGSRVRATLGGMRAVFHRPHPQKEADKAMVRSVRRFLDEGGVKP